jgi:hypothetical protein
VSERAIAWVTDCIARRTCSLSRRFGDVAQEGVKARPAIAGGVLLRGARDRHLDRELVAVAVEGAQLNALTEDRPLAGAQKSLQAAAVGLAEALRDDRVGHGTAQHLLAGEPERALGRAVELHDPPVGIHRHERFVRSVEDRPGEDRTGGWLAPALCPR